jgi:CheY-like chemotaxis protein
VVQSGGFVRVESTLGRGTSFRVFLPSVQEPLPAAASVPARPSAHRGSETVLVCDDYEPLHSVTRLTLESYGYRVLVADHPAQAIELARAAEPPPALLVTDVVMPGMSGRELADRMLCEHPHLRVLFISGYAANPSLREQATEGEVAFLAKPFKPEDLARRVREVLDQDALARPHPCPDP